MINSTPNLSVISNRNLCESAAAKLLPVIFSKAKSNESKVLVVSKTSFIISFNIWIPDNIPKEANTDFILIFKDLKALVDFLVSTVFVFVDLLDLFVALVCLSKESVFDFLFVVLLFTAVVFWEVNVVFFLITTSK